MLALLLLQVLFGNFVQKWVIPDGKNSYGRILVGDIDHDELTDVVVRRNQEIKVMFYELNLQNQWQLKDSIVDDGDHLVWDAGDFDLDGYSDLVFQKTFGVPNIGIAVYESSDSFSYPTQEVWRDTVGFAVVQPISAYDVDNDGFSELFDNNGNGQPSFFWIFESIGDNLYDTVYTTNPDTTLLDGPVSTHAFGDFDGDGKIEFAMGGMSAGMYGATYWIYESPGDNTYEQVIQDYVPTKNIKDCFCVPDADGDGKLEFVIKGFVIPSAEVHAFIFEATGDNTYEIIRVFTLPGGDYYGGYSDVGDVDGDSMPEIVLEGRQTVHIIKAAANDSFYVWETLPGNNAGSSIRVYDIDGNGLSEVVISGNDQTRIYEYQVGIDELVSTDIQRVQFEIFPNPFRDVLQIVFHSKEIRERAISIYDISGRLVKQYRQPTGAQQYQIFWDGRDNYGHQLPGGVYFVHLETVEYSETKKVVLLD